MLDTYVTVVGNLVADPRLIDIEGRPAMASFRVASTPRRYDRAAGEWRDGETLFTGVTCWRGLAENVALSLKKGQSVIVHGRLMKRGYEARNGEHRETVDIDALAVGPDLTRVAAVVKRVERSSSSAPLDTAPLDTVPAGEAATEAEPVSPRPESEEFDAALPAVEPPDADGDGDDLDDGGAGDLDGNLDGDLDAPVLVAFDGSPASSRMLHMLALLGLAESRETHVLSIDTTSETAAVERAAQACDLLRRHGVARVHGIGLGDREAGSPAETILGTAKTLGVGLIAMGAYGHRGIREIFGSCTREVLQDATKTPFLLRRGDPPRTPATAQRRFSKRRAISLRRGAMEEMRPYS
jgi:single-strand DNA-binding protein